MVDQMDQDEEEFLYGNSEEKPTEVQEDSFERDPKTRTNEIAAESITVGSESEVNDESDSDIEVIIETKKGERAEAPKKDGFANMRISRAGIQESIKTDEEKEVPAKLTAINLNEVANFDGKPITDVDVDDFEDKPWRRPGADITDYFNYGFDEITWKAYISKQSSIRQNYGTQNFMNDIMAQMAVMGGNPDAMMQMSMMQNLLQNPDMNGMPGFSNMQEMMQIGAHGLPQNEIPLNPVVGKDYTERERLQDRERNREREKERDIARDRDREAYRERDRDRDRDSHRDRDRDREREKEKEKERDRSRDHNRDHDSGSRHSVDDREISNSGQFHYQRSDRTQRSTRNTSNRERNRHEDYRQRSRH